MKFCDERIQKHLLSGGKIKRLSDTYEIVIGINCNGVICDSDYSYYSFSDIDLTTDDWKIIEPKYDWDKIIKDKILCIFSDDKDFKDEIISILTNIDDDYYYTTNGLWFKYCRLFNPAEFNIAKDLKEYEK